MLFVITAVTLFKRNPLNSIESINNVEPSGILPSERE